VGNHFGELLMVNRPYFDLPFSLGSFCKHLQLHSYIFLFMALAFLLTSQFFS
jgi:hypothetical protein